MATPRYTTFVIFIRKRREHVSISICMCNKINTIEQSVSFHFCDDPDFSVTTLLCSTHWCWTISGRMWRKSNLSSHCLIEDHIRSHAPHGLLNTMGSLHWSKVLVPRHFFNSLFLIFSHAFLLIFVVKLLYTRLGTELALIRNLSIRDQARIGYCIWEEC